MTTYRAEHKRDELDRYYTRDEVARACVSVLPEPYRLPITNSRAWLIEPSLGRASFARAMRQRWPDAVISGVDIDPAAPGFADSSLNACACMDWMDVTLCGYTASAVVGNPPFSEAELHISQALRTAAVVGFLLRLNFLGGQKRQGFWRANPPTDVHVLSRRPSFTDDGKTDGQEYAFFIWDQRETLPMPPRIHWLDWAPEPAAGEQPQSRRRQVTAA